MRINSVVVRARRDMTTPSHILVENGNSGKNQPDDTLENINCTVMSSSIVCLDYFGASRRQVTAARIKGIDESKN